MNGEKSFREIFFEQMGQKSTAPEVNRPFFDPTLSEATPPSLPRFQFYSQKKHSQYATTPRKSAGADNAHKATSPSSTSRPHVAPAVTSRPERRLETQHLLTAPQKASLQMLQDHLKTHALLPITESAFKRLYRLTMKKCHPDQGGDARTFVRVRQAFKELERAFPNPPPPTC